MLSRAPIRREARYRRSPWTGDRANDPVQVSPNRQHDSKGDPAAGSETDEPCRSGILSRSGTPQGMEAGRKTAKGRGRGAATRKGRGRGTHPREARTRRRGTKPTTGTAEGRRHCVIRKGRCRAERHRRDRGCRQTGKGPEAGIGQARDEGARVTLRTRGWHLALLVRGLL